MMVSDSIFEEWLENDMRRPVWTLEVRSVDENDDEHVIYFSNRDFMHPTEIFFGVMHFPSFRQSISNSVTANFSEIGFGSIVLDDAGLEFAQWRTFRNLSATLRLGDVNWDFDTHRVMMHAVIEDWKPNGRQYEIKLLDNQTNADTLIEYADITTKTGMAGVLLKGLLLDAEAFTAVDIDQASFDALDAQYGYNLTIESFEGTQNVMDIADSILSGFPVDYGVNILGKVEVFLLARPVEASAKHLILMADPEFGDTLWPLQKVVLSNSAYDDVELEDEQIKSDWPANSREESASTLVNTAAQATQLGQAQLDLYNTPIDPVQLLVSPMNINRTDTVYFEYNNYGFANGVYAVVTDYEFLENGLLQLEVAIWR